LKGKTAQLETFERENTYTKGLNQSLKKNKLAANDENPERTEVSLRGE